MYEYQPGADTDLKRKRKNIFPKKNFKSLWTNDKLKKSIYKEMRKVEGYQIDEEINNLKRRKIQEISVVRDDSAGIFKQSMGGLELSRNGVVVPARQSPYL